VVFAATSKSESLRNISGFVTVELVFNCKYSKVVLNVEEIKENINVSNGKSLTASKVGSLKCRVIQVDAFGLDITLREFKLVPEL
jgi:hypothetical protein